jgi:hypothetical protein
MASTGHDVHMRLPDDLLIGSKMGVAEDIWM